MSPADRMTQVIREGYGGRCLLDDPDDVFVGGLPHPTPHYRTRRGLRVGREKSENGRAGAVRHRPPRTSHGCGRSLAGGDERPQRAWLTAVSRAVVIALALSTSTTPRDPPRERGADARTPSGASLRQLAETSSKRNQPMQAPCIRLGERYIHATATSTLRKPSVPQTLEDFRRVTAWKHHASSACLFARRFCACFHSEVGKDSCQQFDGSRWNGGATGRNPMWIRLGQWPAKTRAADGATRA